MYRIACVTIKENVRRHCSALWLGKNLEHKIIGKFVPSTVTGYCAALAANSPAILEQADLLK
jgi:hypothetical protein